MTAILQAMAASIIFAGTSAVTVTTMLRDVADLPLPQGSWEQGRILDGHSFRIVQTSPETGDETNELRFVDGKFQSARCIGYCDYGWTPYQTWTEGDRIHFSAVTRCADAPYAMVWLGVVTGDAVEVTGTWTVRRWYWTLQIGLTGAGEAIAG